MLPSSPTSKLPVGFHRHCMPSTVFSIRLTPFWPAIAWEVSFLGRTCVELLEGVPNWLGGTIIRSIPPARTDVRWPQSGSAEIASAAGQGWYAAYGSNLAEDRFLCYVRGGRPAGGKVNLLGCR